MATAASVAVFCASTCSGGGDRAAQAYLRPPAVRLLIERAGVYEVSGAELGAAGCELDTRDAASLKLFCDGRETPIEVVGGDGSFDTEHVIRFYAEATGSVYTRYNVYWLTLGGGPGRRIEPQPPARDTSSANAGRPSAEPYHMATVRIEPQKLYVAALPPEPDGDHWFAGRIGYDAPATLSVDLPGLLLDVPERARVRVRLYGLSKLPAKPDHCTQVAIGDAVVATAQWDGQAPYILQGAIPPGALKAHGNTARVECVRQEGVQFDLAYLDWIEITYPRDFAAPSGLLRFRAPDARPHLYSVTKLPSVDAVVWRIDSPANVRRIDARAVAGEGEAVRFADAGAPENAQYVVATREGVLKVGHLELDSPSSLRSDTNQADYIVIGHSSLLEAVEPLAQHRRSAGLTVLVADVQDVYDEFTFGRADPSAIKRFIRFAYEGYCRPAPRFVLLVGDASYDYKGYLSAVSNLVPTYMIQTSDFGQTASDQWFVCLAGDDASPELAIGRIPGRSPNGVAAVVRKILRHETSAPSAVWQPSVTFVGDDNETRFRGMCEASAAVCQAHGWTTDELYLEKGGRNSPEVNNRLLSALNQGRQLVVYAGHATFDAWAHERVLTMDDVHQLANGRELPVVLSLSCSDGFFAHATRPQCLAEAWILNPSGGAVACWSPTTMSYSPVHEVLLNELTQAIFTRRAATLGEAIQLAIRNMLGQERNRHGRDEALMYVFFGDPAMPIRSWWESGG